eukprot:4766701-Prymnesium_polylepis.1
MKRLQPKGTETDQMLKDASRHRSIGVASVAEPQPLLHPDHESSDRLAPRLKAHFELEDAQAEASIAVVTGRPNFLKTTQVLRARRTRHPQHSGRSSRA